MLLSLPLSLALSVSPAEAGKLANGYRGQAWGEVALDSLATVGECSSSVESQVGRICRQDFASAEAEVAYMYDLGVFFGIYLVANGYSNCSTIFEVLSAGYGRGRPKVASLDSWEDDRFWFDGPVGASWSYNRFSKQCTLTVSHTTLYERISAPSEAAAKSAAEGL
jgi:hypothetical protein